MFYSILENVLVCALSPSSLRYLGYLMVFCCCYFMRKMCSAGFKPHSLLQRQQMYQIHVTDKISLVLSQNPFTYSKNI